jgi:hypothetical protein
LAKSEDALRKLEVLPHLKGKFPLVISSAVYTQIFYMQALSLFAGHIERYTEEEITRILQSLHILQNTVITSYNDLLVSMLAPNGTILVWSDVAKIAADGQFEERLQSLQTESERMDFVLNEVRNRGREEAVFGLEDLQNRLAEEEEVFHYWIWPYSKKNYCLAFGILGKVKSRLVCLKVGILEFIWQYPLEFI